jgi:glycosyltransferase involved in cell wall biosynthesis
VTISEHGKREVVDLLGIPAWRVQVAYPAVDPTFRPLPREQVEEFRARRGLPPRFALYLGTLEPRKNAIALVRAFAHLRARRGHGPALVLAGGEGWQTSALYAEVEARGLGDAVLFPGYVDPAEQVLWYNAAAVFVYPSLYEGFGLPPLEALACGVPVVTSSLTSLPEVVGDVGRMAAVDAPDALAEAIANVLADRALRDWMREAGPRQARRFTWENMARRTVGAYREAAAMSGQPSGIPAAGSRPARG